MGVHLRWFDLNKSERHNVIVDDLGREPALRVNEMSRRYDVSSETIRRDLAELMERGLINRTYGGAVRIITHEPALSERQHIQVAERKAIAKLAYDLIEPDDVLMIGGGITTNVFAHALALFKEPLTVITPSFNVAIALGTCSNISVHVLPGEFNGSEGLVQGSETTEALKRFRGTKSFLGASGLSEEGPSDAAIPAGRIYQTMAERSMHSYILADSSKFGKAALSGYCVWAPNISLISDRNPDDALTNILSAAGVDVMLPDTI